MMTMVDELAMAAPAQLCFRVAADVERWPDILSHYRWVKFHRKDGFGTGRVEMAAWREFARAVRYPTRWVSEMAAIATEPAIYFQHVAGITRGMDVKWSFEPGDDSTQVRITHAWAGPRWPLIGGIVWRYVIGPYFVRFIAKRTLAGIAREAERTARAETDMDLERETETSHAG
jgi:uncharacterized membrane protein